MTFHAPTVSLHINQHQCRCKWSEGCIMWPIIWYGTDLSFLDSRLGSWPWFLGDWSMIVSRIQNRQRPYAGVSCGHHHEWTVHKTGRPFTLARLFREPITRSVLATAVTTQPHLRGAPWFLFCWRARGLYYDVVPVCLPMCLYGCKQRCTVRISTLWRRKEFHPDVGDIL